MANVTTKSYHVSPTMRFVDNEGRLTGNGFDLIKALSEIVTTIEIEDGEVTASKISVTSLAAISATLGNVVVDGDLIVNGTITTGKHLTNAIVIAGFATNTSDFSIGSETTASSVAITPNGGKVVVTGMVASNHSNDSGLDLKIKRNGVTQVSEIVVTGLSGKAANGTLVWVDTNPGTSAVTYSITAQTNGTHVFSSIAAENHKNA